MRRAILSVTDKSGIVEFALRLVERDFEILASGGTANAIRTAGIPVTSLTGLPHVFEMLDGRVKTLSPSIHAGLLADGSLTHNSELAEQGFPWIDLVAVDLYPLQNAILQRKPPDLAVEEVDMGGVALLRSALKGWRFPVCDPADYGKMISILDMQEGDEQRHRHALALRLKALNCVAAYDMAWAWYENACAGIVPVGHQALLICRFLTHLRDGQFQGASTGEFFAKLGEALIQAQAR